MFKNILVPVDLDHESSWTRALPAALEFVTKGGGNLHLVTVAPNIMMTAVAQYIPEGYEAKISEDARAALEKLADEYASGHDARPGVQIHLRHGSISREIVDLADEVGIDLIVMASHRPEMIDYLIGPNAAHVVRHANCSVLVVRTG